MGKRPSFINEYREWLSDRNVFVGRAHELELIEVCLGQAVEVELKSSAPSKKRKASRKMKHGSLILIESGAGMGKTTLVSRAKKLGKGRIKIVMATSNPMETQSQYSIFSSLLQAFTGLHAKM